MGENGFPSFFRETGESGEALGCVLTAWSFALIDSELDEIHDGLEDVASPWCNSLLDLRHFGEKKRSDDCESCLLKFVKGVSSLALKAN